MNTTQTIRAIILIKNKWTDKEHAYPVIYTNESDLKKKLESWNTTNSTVKPQYL